VAEKTFIAALRRLFVLGSLGERQFTLQTAQTGRGTVRVINEVN